MHESYCACTPQEVGTDKSKILQAQVWVKDMEYFAAMNEVPLN